MKNGFLKVAAATPEIKVGECKYNAIQIAAMIRQAYKEGAQMIVFPELCVTGYTCGDLFLQDVLLSRAKETLVELALSTKGMEIIAIAGLPFSFSGKLYNAAAVLYDGEVLGIVPKSYLPNYAEFYEARHFSSGIGITGYVDLGTGGEGNLTGGGTHDGADDDDAGNGDASYTGADDDDDADDAADDDTGNGDSVYNLEGDDDALEGDDDAADDADDDTADHAVDDDTADCSADDDGDDAFSDIPFGTDLLFRAVNIENFTFAVEICEDLWVPDPPSTRHAMAGASVLVNLSASDETIGKADYRRKLVAGQSARTVSAYIYADAGAGESTTDLVFSGHNIIAENGTLLAESEQFKGGITYAEIDLCRLESERRRMTTFISADPEDYEIIDVDIENNDADITRKFDPAPFVPKAKRERDQRCEEILSIQTEGLKTRLEHTGIKHAVVGISGGLDSTLALIVTARAFDRLKLPREGILAVTMPGFGTTDRTHNNAKKLINRLGAVFKEIPIGEAVKLHLKQIGHAGDRDVTYENAQARQRTYLLMDLANSCDGIVVGTGDLSELALGWATYNGDHMSMYGVNAGVPKTLVRHLVNYCADSCADSELSKILRDILDTPVSPELLPPSEDGKIAQKTEETVGPYELHDFFLYYILRFGFSPKRVLYLARNAFGGRYDGATIKKWLKVFYSRFFSQQFKRSCMPDGPKVGSVALSPRGDWRMPSDASVYEWMRELDGKL